MRVHPIHPRKITRKDPQIRKGDGTRNYLPKNKAHLFMELIAKIAEIKGSLNKALDLLKINGSAYDRLKNDRLITDTLAKRIIETYKKIKPCPRMGL